MVGLLTRRTGDEGLTLIEVVTATAIMSIVMSLFTAGILQMYRTVNRTQATATVQAQLHIAFQRLDKEIRYAVGLSTPGAVGADPYVEYLTANTGSPICAELRLHVATAQLQRRTWTQGASPLVPGPWTPLAAGVTGATPFTVLPADATFNAQRLRLQLTATAKQVDVTFTAVNTSLTTASTTLCTEGRPIP